MKNINLFLRDNLQTLKIKSNNQKSIKKFDKIFAEIKNEIHDEKLNVLNNNFHLALKFKNLKILKNIKMLF